ncbi:MAG TPA: caa(3)-type oxidase subunit IV [Myxococcales bacterium]|nr:caa(3)-type oxidase subunit IV [Myxococcales bacterium]
MSENSLSESSHTNYVKIWAILLALLIVSYLGPMLEIQIVTLVTAFGIAVVKAYMVAKHFMHVDHVPKFVPYLMITCLVFMLLFVAGTAPDVYQDSGDNWVKPEAQWQYMPPQAADHAGPAHH